MNIIPITKSNPKGVTLGISETSEIMVNLVRRKGASN